MRFPLPILGALVVALAAVYLVTVHTQATTVIVDATSLAAGENVTLTLDYIPHKITFYITPYVMYNIIIEIPNTTYVVHGYAGPNEPVVYGRFETGPNMYGVSDITLGIDVISAPPRRPHVKITVVRPILG